ncbi:hypothetical protein [Rhizobium sp.]
MLLRRILSPMALAVGLFPQAVLAADPPPPVIEKVEIFVLREDDGTFSKDMANAPDATIVANDENGFGTQLLIKAVLKAEPNALYENPPVVRLKVTPSLFVEGGPKTVENEQYLSFFTQGGRQYRGILIDHGCNDFQLEAWVTAGGKKVSEFKKTYSVLCGD